MTADKHARLTRKQWNRLITQEHRRIWLRGVMIAAAAGGLILLILVVATPMRTDGQSMSPTLSDGEWLLVNRWDREPEYGDVIVIAHNGHWIVKRVMGLPGDTIDLLADGTILRNGEPMQETGTSKEPCDQTFPMRVAQEKVFVLGDNRAVSVDSRSKEIGLIPFADIIGKPWYGYEYK